MTDTMLQVLIRVVWLLVQRSDITDYRFDEFKKVFAKELKGV